MQHRPMNQHQRTRFTLPNLCLLVRPVELLALVNIDKRGASLAIRLLPHEAAVDPSWLAMSLRNILRFLRTRS